MKLIDYLEGIRNCPDESLATECGINANYPILLGAPFEEYIQNLDKINFELVSIKEKNSYRYLLANYKPGTVLLSGYDFVPSVVCSNVIFIDERAHPNYEQRVGDYKMEIILQPIQGVPPHTGKSLESVCACRALAMAIEEIGKGAIERKIPIYFPRSFKYESFNQALETGDFKEVISQVVYFPDEE